LAVGFGVDTARSPNREILALWHAYLQNRDHRTQPLPVLAEQAQWPIFDSGPHVPGLRHYTVVYLAPAVGLDSTVLIRTLVSAVSD
jgi:hypothetical protein